MYAAKISLCVPNTLNAGLKGDLRYIIGDYRLICLIEGDRLFTAGELAKLTE